MAGKNNPVPGLQTAATPRGENAPARDPASKPKAKSDEVRVADHDKVFAAVERIAERDRELLKRLAR